MKTDDSGRGEARTRAMRRLHRMTIGTAIAAVAATGGLGWLAAVTHDGSQAAAATAIVSTQRSTDGGTTTGAPSAGVVSAPTVSAASGVAIATTGGS